MALIGVKDLGAYHGGSHAIRTRTRNHKLETRNLLYACLDSTAPLQFSNTFQLEVMTDATATHDWRA